MDNRKNNTRRNFFKQGCCAIASMHMFLESCAGMPNKELNKTENRFIEVDLFINKIDLKEQQSFYVSKLDLPILNKSQTGFSIKAGKTQINFIVDDTINKPFYHIAFNIPENKINQAKEWTKGRFDLLATENGEDIIHFKRWNAHSIYFFDPAGNILEFIAHHNLDNKSNGEFNTKDILYLIEVGLVSEDVKTLAADIKSKIGLKDYLRADELSNSSNFRALGDTAGMLILSRTERDWLMTNKPAKEVPLNLKVKNKTKGIVNLENDKYKIDLIKGNN